MSNEITVEVEPWMGDVLEKAHQRYPVVRIKLAHPDAKVPLYQSAGAAGCDLHLADDATLAPGARAALSTNVCIELPEGFEAQVRGRSGLFLNSGLLVATGTVDADYRGVVGVLVANIGQYEIQLRAGDRIAQLVIGPVARASFELVDELGDTVRGERGFGSSGL